jgi:iodotyrosine deiodinase
VTEGGYRPVPLRYERPAPEEALARSRAFLERMRTRRTVRQFSPEVPPVELVENAVATAGSAPSGANQQPWTFAVVAGEGLKRELREAAEAEEHKLYEQRASPEWLDALHPLGTGWEKPHLTDAPYLIVVFEQAYGVDADGAKRKHYYVRESVGIAVGFLLAALHEAGLVALTHTPSPMGFLARLLDRPEGERPFLLVATGYPADGAVVPDIGRKPLDEIAVFLDG